MEGVHFLEALRYNTTLTYLDISSFQLSKFSGMLNFLEENYTLQTLNLFAKGYFANTEALEEMHNALIINTSLTNMEMSSLAMRYDTKKVNLLAKVKSELSGNKGKFLIFWNSKN